MINPVSSSHASHASQQTQPAVPKAQPPNKLPQDTVSLKSTAPKSTGDVDHHGDHK